MYTMTSKESHVNRNSLLRNAYNNIIATHKIIFKLKTGLHYSALVIILFNNSRKLLLKQSYYCKAKG